MHFENITTTRRCGRRAGYWLSLILACAPALVAHDGFTHVIGTVVKADSHVLTVKTAKGNVDVSLNDQTEITKGGQKAAAADLKAGARVVVDVPEDSKDKAAHAVKISAAAATKK